MKQLFVALSLGAFFVLSFSSEIFASPCPQLKGAYRCLDQGQIFKLFVAQSGLLERDGLENFLLRFRSPHSRVQDRYYEVTTNSSGRRPRCQNSQLIIPIEGTEGYSQGEARISRNPHDGGVIVYLKYFIPGERPYYTYYRCEPDAPGVADLLRAARAEDHQE